MLNVYEVQESNKKRSALIMILFVVFITAVVWLMAKAFGYGWDVVGLALIFSGLISFSSYWWGDKLILIISNARLADRERDFNFYTVTENLAMAAQIPMPKLYVIEDSAPNAFATGRDPQHAVICATRGLLEKLNRTELEGVIAHEISHIKNYDIRLMSIVTILVGMISLLGDWFLRMGSGGKSREYKRGGEIFLLIGIILALLSPLIARLIQLALSRRREFLADSSAVMLTRYPLGLASALEKIAKDKEPLEVANKATAHLYIVNPLKNLKNNVGWFANLFSTHPPIEERIRRLKEMV
ncbi:MAG: M48 family metallopeptidase [Microgenomates group bacterium]